MTANRLSAVAATGGANKAMRPGEVRSIYVQQFDRTITITRTNREYVYDLCDAYNNACGVDGVEWFVAHNGELKMRPAGEPLRTDWRPWKPNEAELAALKRNLQRIGNAA